VLVDEERILMKLDAKQPVGSRLDVGFPVVVVQVEDDAGGGLVVAADRVDDSSVG
jgi:hypothetical protein